MASRLTQTAGKLRSIVRKRLLCPTWIAWIAPVVARITISTAAIDEECSLKPIGGEIALKCAYVVSDVVALERGVVEHDGGACWGRFVVEDRQHSVGWVGLETVAALNPFLQEEIVADVAHNSLWTIREKDGHR